MKTRTYVAGKHPKAESIALVRLAYSERTRRSKGTPTWMIPGIERRRDLANIVAYRLSEGLAIGPDQGWALVIANLCLFTRGEVDADAVQEAAVALGRGPLDDGTVAAVVAELGVKTYSRRKLQTARAVGSLLELTSVEREDLKIRRIDAIDEPARQRRKRRQLELLRAKRAAKAALRATSVEKQKPWEAEGVSRRTWYYRRQKIVALKLSPPPSKKEGKGDKTSATIRIED